jgi:hypothetical protein
VSYLTFNRQNNNGCNFIIFTNNDYNSNNDGHDIITDFNLSEGDKLDISDLIDYQSGDNLADFVGQYHKLYYEVDTSVPGRKAATINIGLQAGLMTIYKVWVFKATHFIFFNNSFSYFFHIITVIFYNNAPVLKKDLRLSSSQNDFPSFLSSLYVRTTNIY